MIDVTFLLLVFFLLTFTFREQEGQIRANLPEKGGRSGFREIFVLPVHVAVHPAGRDGRDVVFEVDGIDSVVTSAEELYSALRARREIIADGRSVVIIKPTQKVRWQYVVEAYNQALRARFEEIGLAPCS